MQNHSRLLWFVFLAVSRPTKAMEAKERIRGTADDTKWKERANPGDRDTRDAGEAQANKWQDVEGTSW